MIEGIVIFVVGYICGMYNKQVKIFVKKYLNKWFDKDEEKNDNI